MPQPLKAKLHYKTGRVKNLNKTHVNTTNSSSNGASTSQNTHSATSSATNARIQHATESTQSVNENSTHETTPSNSSGTNSSDSPAIEQFELELFWCIQTLEKSIELGKLNPKQIQDTEKTIRLLKSKTQPLIKKRQLMQLALGDYRKKMIDEEKKLKKGNTSIEFVNSSTKLDKKGSASDSQSANSQCHFVKKSFTSSLGDASFRFKFPVDEIGKLSLETPRNETKICDKNTSNENSVATVPQQSDQIDSNLVFVRTKWNNASNNNSFKFNFNI